MSALRYCRRAPHLPGFGRCVALAVLLLALLVPAMPARAQNEAAATVVERLHAALIEAMQLGTEAGGAGRRALLAPVIREVFDFDTICRIVTGSHYRNFTDAQRDAFRATFERLSIATYADNFRSFDGERFETLSVVEQSNSVVVNTRLITGAGEPVALNYVLREVNGGWRVVNVLAQGVSDVALKRAEYTAAIGNDGFDSLLKRLDDKIATLESDP
jgi:phospholipid transport system substrate-binding protein